MKLRHAPDWDEELVEEYDSLGVTARVGLPGTGTGTATVAPGQAAAVANWTGPVAPMGVRLSPLTAAGKQILYSDPTAPPGDVPHAAVQLVAGALPAGLRAPYPAAGVVECWAVIAYGTGDVLDTVTVQWPVMGTVVDVGPASTVSVTAFLVATTGLTESVTCRASVVAELAPTVCHLRSSVIPALLGNAGLTGWMVYRPRWATAYEVVIMMNTDSTAPVTGQSMDVRSDGSIAVTGAYRLKAHLAGQTAGSSGYVRWPLMPTTIGLVVQSMGAPATTNEARVHWYGAP